MTGQSTSKSSPTTGSIVRVDKSAGRWEAIPKALIEDDRLSVEARWLVIWLCARPPGWEIRATSLPRLLKDQSRARGHLGRDLIRRLLRELERAGYLVRTRQRNADGRWVWRSCLNATRQVASTSDGLAGDGPAIAGAAVDGEGGDLLQTELIQTRNYLKRTTTTAAALPDSNPIAQNVDVVSINGLQFPEVLAGDTQPLAMMLISKCPAELRQAVLDQVARCQESGRIRSPLGLLYRLVQRAQVGEFVANVPIIRRNKVHFLTGEQNRNRTEAISADLRPAAEIAAEQIAVLRQKWLRSPPEDQR